MKTAVVVVTVVYQCMISQYSPGVMSEVVYNRQSHQALPHTLPDVDGFAAVRDCERIGSILSLKPEGGQWESFLAVDCAHSDEVRAWMDGINMWAMPIAAEVDYPTAVRWRTVGDMQPGYVMVSEHVLVPMSRARPPYLVE